MPRTHISTLSEYTRVAQKKPTAGAQKKGEKTGVYERNNKKYYIKQSALYPADNIAEVATSILLQLPLGALATPYEFVCVEDETIIDPVYIASEMRPGFESLQTRLINHNGLRPWMKVGSNPLLLSEKQRIDALLNDQQKQDVAALLAGCLWVRNDDCHIENTYFYKENKNNSNESIERVGEYDYGWGLTGICKLKHRRVDLFRVKPLFAKIGTHEFGGVPTNHFHDYPNIIRSDLFVKALEHVVQTATVSNIIIQVEKIMNSVQSAYNKSPFEQRNALLNFARHLGIGKSQSDTEKLFSGRSVLDMKKLIQKELVTTLKARADSMDLLRCFLKLELALQTKEKKGLKGINEILQEIKTVIQTKFNKVNGYDMSGKISDVFPTFDPMAKNLFKKVLQKNMVVDKDIKDLCKLLTRDTTSLQAVQEAISKRNRQTLWAYNNNFKVNAARNCKKRPSAKRIIF